jgi:hypothetical protein
VYHGMSKRGLPLSKNSKAAVGNESRTSCFTWSCDWSLHPLSACCGSRLQAGCLSTSQRTCSTFGVYHHAADCIKCVAAVFDTLALPTFADEFPLV